MTLAADRPVLTGTFDSLNPRTGEVVATFPIHTPADVQAAVARAKTAAAWWRELGWGGRRERLHAWKKLIGHRCDERPDLVHGENGKPVSDARLTEVTLPVDHIAWAA